MSDNAARLDYDAIKARAVERALQLGASARVAPAKTDAASRDRMREAFARGDFVTWRYDDTYASRACDPAEILPDARSVVCVALPYATKYASRRDVRRGRVSNYAWSSDYHLRMRALLDDVASVIDSEAEARVTAVACDTRPLAERAFAARAGVGWVGKHTNLIAPAAGSFVFLGEI
ncbi:MAG TPA: QueG-associated DUF1730 domain-containing protein, partial [Candidatus Baltobacteraceae bacterium]|nr:QueG-associated DUF1730 domain-containing protein [Candidatus Baltobacteraceae bacterium]